MFAIVEIEGKQFQIQEQDEVKVPKLEQEAGSKVVFDKVLLINNDGNVVVGQPVIDKASVATTVLDHGKDAKVLVFKKKRRKDYRRKVGHRQEYTVIKVDAIKTK